MVTFGIGVVIELLLSGHMFTSTKYGPAHRFGQVCVHLGRVATECTTDFRGTATRDTEFGEAKPVRSGQYCQHVNENGNFDGLPILQRS